jgi:hypothetical protein
MSSRNPFRMDDPRWAEFESRRGRGPIHRLKIVEGEQMERWHRLRREPARHLVIRPSLRDDWRNFLSEVRGSPYSHAIVTLAGLVAGLLLVIIPALIGAGLLS